MLGKIRFVYDFKQIEYKIKPIQNWTSLFFVQLLSELNSVICQKLNPTFVLLQEIQPSLDDFYLFIFPGQNNGETSKVYKWVLPNQLLMHLTFWIFDCQIHVMVWIRVGHQHSESQRYHEDGLFS